MGTENTTLIQLQKIHSAISVNPKISLSRFCVNQLIPKHFIAELIQSNIICNKGDQGVRRWEWKSIIPNIYMAAELEKRTCGSIEFQSKILLNFLSENDISPGNHPILLSDLNDLLTDYIENNKINYKPSLKEISTGLNVIGFIKKRVSKGNVFYINRSTIQPIENHSEFVINHVEHLKNEDYRLVPEMLFEIMTTYPDLSFSALKQIINNY